jgi:hypothetical protein
MVQRYAHPPLARERAAVDTFDLVRDGHAMATSDEFEADTTDGSEPETIVLWVIGGRQEDRTPDLRVANAALSQLS